MLLDSINCCHLESAEGRACRGWDLRGVRFEESGRDRRRWIGQSKGPGPAREGGHVCALRGWGVKDDPGGEKQTDFQGRVRDLEEGAEMCLKASFLSAVS